jgi:hypothetical protein
MKYSIQKTWRLLPIGSVLLFSVSSHAQTAPELPGPEDRDALPAVFSTAASENLIRDAFDADTNGVQTSAPTDKVEIVQAKEQVKEGQGALAWSYQLDLEKTPELSIEAGPSLTRANSVRFWLRTDQPAAVGVFFEAPREAGSDAAPQRYSTTVWSNGTGWQPIELSIDRFVTESAAIDKAPPPPSWNSIGRYGVMDMTNQWLRRAGQARVKATRRLWIDDFQVSTRYASNLPLLPVAPPGTEPANPPAQLPNEAENDAPMMQPDQMPNQDIDNNGADFNPDNQQNGTENMPGNGNEEGNGNFEGNANGNEDGNGNFGGNQEFGNNGEDNNGGDEPQQPVDPTREMWQDRLGDPALWVPINTQTSRDANGIQWNYIRLANRVLALMAPVNGTLFEGFPPTVQPGGTKLTWSDLGKYNRRVRLVLELSTQKLTKINVAVTERSGATYSTTVLVDSRKRMHRETLYLNNFQVERTRPDANKQIDLDQIEYITISDVGAQTNVSGPNQITLKNVHWAY